MEFIHTLKAVLCAAAIIFAASDSPACTSAIVSARASATGRPLLWKHRDTGADNNFLMRVEAAKGEIGYVGLFNGGDSLLTEAWMGMNDAGFAIMNTASYNLAPDTAHFKDQEGIVMARALRTCTSVADFGRLLDSLPKPLGVQANFGVIDGNGGAAYFETDDYSYSRFDVNDTPDGIIIRSNYSFSGDEGTGYGYIRYNTADSLIRKAAKLGPIAPELFTEELSRSYYHSLLGRDMYMDDYVVDQDFIPRNISTSSIVVEGVNPAMPAADMLMWAALGYPPCAETKAATLTDIPEDFGPSAAGWNSPACDEAMKLRRSAIPFRGGSGPKYLDLRVIRPINELKKARSLKNYADRRSKMKK